MIPDIAVVGGGVIGLTCAWRLAQGGARVALFEKVQVGREASWASGGMLAPLCEAEGHPLAGGPETAASLLQFSLQSLQMYSCVANDLLEATGIDIELCLQGAPQDWRRPGIMYVGVENDPIVERLLPRGEGASWAGRPAVWLQNEGQVEPRKLVDALRKAVEKLGVVIHEGKSVKRVISENGRATALATEAETFAVGGVLLAAGAWSGKIAGLRESYALPVKPVAGQMLGLRSEKRIQHVVYSHNCYLIPRRDGRLLVGATVEDTGFNKRVTAAGVAALLTAAMQLAPELATAPFEAHWAGLRPTTPDSLPILGPGPLHNLWLATGHGRNGILWAPATGQALADGILRNCEWNPAFGYQRATLPA